MTISPAQSSFLASLVGERLATLGFATVAEALSAMNAASLDKSQASILIGRLKGMPKDPDATMPEVVAKATRNGKGNRPGPCHTCGHLVDQDAGFYFLKSDGRWAVHHKVGACSNAPLSAPTTKVDEGWYRLKNGRIVMIYKTRNGRLAGKALNGHHLVYEQGLVSQAGFGTRLDGDELARIAYEYGLSGRCMFCARDLTDDRSNPHRGGVGYGPVCADKYGLPWGEVKEVTFA